MKKIGEYTIRGQVPHGTEERVTLFDGKFDTAYRIKSIETMPNTFSGTADGSIICATEPNTAAVPTFSDGAQIAWASMAYDGNFGSPGGLSIIDPDNLIVEDLYIQGFSNDATRQMNYIITLEKYEISDWQGALAMVRNLSLIHI